MSELSVKFDITEVSWHTLRSVIHASFFDVNYWQTDSCNFW